MSSNIFKSIEAIEPHHVIDTGCKPLLVHANNMEFYLIKYAIGSGSANMLSREFIAAHFCKIWNIPSPEFNFIQIEDKHLSADLGIGVVKLPRVCFGTIYNKKLKEFDRFFEDMPTIQVKKIINPNDFLKIAFFDLWISNEDRHPSNYNMLINPKVAGYEFTAIDHGACLHSGNEDKENYELNYEDSILSSPILITLYNFKQLTDTNWQNEMKLDWYICHINCKNKLHEIVNELPTSWQINKPKLIDQLHLFMMNDSWFDKCWNTFLKYLQIQKNH